MEIAAVIAGMIAVSSMVHGTVLLLRETTIAVRVISDRAASVRERVELRRPLTNQVDAHL